MWSFNFVRVVILDLDIVRDLEYNRGMQIRRIAMNYMTAKEAADLWGISQRRVAILCSDGRVQNAEMLSNMWLIPKDSQKPDDGRSLRYTKEQKLKPFLKWAGGKGQLLDEIRRHYPTELGSSIYKYAEPFVGGGAVLFDVLSNYDVDDVYISDSNAELINVYISLRDDSEALINALKQYESAYLPMDDDQRKSFYYKKRSRFNELKKAGQRNFELAALFIFLNRTCFNGLYRVNSKGEYNVPMGAYKSPTICDEDNLRRVAKALNGVTIVCGDYKESASFVDEHTFAYFDPPYRPLPNSASFIAYTENDFDDGCQIELGKYIKRISESGVYVVASNSDPKNTDPNDNFFDELYSGMEINRINASRMINSNASARGKISELLICSRKGGSDMKRDFDEWLSKFRLSIFGYDYYVDFQKVISNVENIKVELNILNSLIGSKNIENDFESILAKYPEVLKCIPILLAIRGYEIYAQDNDGTFLYRFDRENYSVNQYKVFMKKTGLFDMIANHIVNNLVDYVYGVETGLDSNGRKNRGGHQMENLVESYIIKAGFLKDVTYFKEMYLSDVETRWDIDLSALSNQGKARKRFDYVVKTPSKIYAIETNFYGGTSGGSKLNETARSYKMLAQESEQVEGFTFVWFTDGTAWRSARGNLRETFDVLDNIYSIDDMENGIMSKLFV